MKDLNILSLDLELNQPSGSIIQVGCVIGNLKTGEILKEFSNYINTTEFINPRISKLTKITQDNVTFGYSLLQAHIELKHLHKKYNCFRNPITWGGGDSEKLRTELDIDKETFLFGRRWIDVKTLYVSYRWANDKSHQAGLAKALTKFDLQFQGQKHNACDDARNTFFIYRELLKRFLEDPTPTLST